jgi:hypothetical protein
MILKLTEKNQRKRSRKNYNSNYAICDISYSRESRVKKIVIEQMSIKKNFVF